MAKLLQNTVGQSRLARYIADYTHIAYRCNFYIFVLLRMSVFDEVCFQRQKMLHVCRNLIDSLLHIFPLKFN
jgi:hypothetical protein